MRAPEAFISRADEVALIRDGEKFCPFFAAALSVIVDRHAGTISLSSRPRGGTIVTMRLPLDPASTPVLA